MINAQIASTPQTARTEARLWRPGSATFWMLLVIEGAIILVAAWFLIGIFPQQSPLSYVEAARQVRDYVVADPAADPLIEVAPGVIDRASSVHGVKVAGEVYYYYYEGRVSYDPLSSGVIKPEQAELLLRDESSATPLVVYRLIGQ
ncbi:MAG: hypothetical protein Fur005_12200 [Roseiflexaceae bacterium]